MSISTVIEINVIGPNEQIARATRAHDHAIPAVPAIEFAGHRFEVDHGACSANLPMFEDDASAVECVLRTKPASVEEPQAFQALGEALVDCGFELNRAWSRKTRSSSGDFVRQLRSKIAEIEADKNGPAQMAYSSKEIEDLIDEHGLSSKIVWGALVELVGSVYASLPEGHGLRREVPDGWSRRGLEWSLLYYGKRWCKEGDGVLDRRSVPDLCLSHLDQLCVPF